MRFKLPDDARQGRPVVVNLRILHPALPVGIIKEFKDCVKRLLRIVDNIGKPAALIVFEERIACDCHTWQTCLRPINVIVNRQAKFEPTIFTVTNIVTIFPEKASANLFRMASYRLKIGKTDVSDNLIERFLKDLSARYVK
jgi:hypothetical protein